MIRMLEDLTGINAREIPLDSKEVMSLFKNTDALGITPDDIRGCPLGCLGVPEFGTDFAMQMLIDATLHLFLILCVFQACPTVQTCGWEMPRI